MRGYVKQINTQNKLAGFFCINICNEERERSFATVSKTCMGTLAYLKRKVEGSKRYC